MLSKVLVQRFLVYKELTADHASSDKHAGAYRLILAFILYSTLCILFKSGETLSWLKENVIENGLFE